jgi:hypothetical protein
MRPSRRLLIGVLWIAAVTLAVTGAVAYLVWPSGWLWWLGSLAALPLLLLVIVRGRDKGEGDPHFVGFDGPFGPP